MRYNPLGRTGLFVSELCLGTMTFGGTDGMWGKIGQLQQGDAERLVGQSLDAGVERLAEQPIGVGLLQVADLAPQAGAAAEGHGAEAQLRDEQARAAKRTMTHGGRSPDQVKADGYAVGEPQAA